MTCWRWARTKGREFVRDQQVIYIYHDKIDLLGDKRGSEQETFDAVAQTLNELNQLASFIVNSLNASLVLMTADHGLPLPGFAPRRCQQIDPWARSQMAR